MRKKWPLLFIAILLYIPLGFLQVSIDYDKKVEELETGLLLMPGQVAGSLILAGFRGLTADLLWLNIENYWHSGQHYKMLPLFEAIGWLQPTYITVWAVGGWHMSYNIFANVKSREKELSENFDKIIKKISDKKDLEPLLKIHSETKKLLEQIIWETSITEKDINEILSQMAFFHSILDRYQDKYKEAVKILREIVAIPEEMISWYINGVKFLQKGITYNPNRYDLYFELGWIYYNKGKDYPNAVRYLEKAIKYPHPEYVDDVLAHAYEKNGQIDMAIKQWEKLLNTSFDTIARRAIKSLKTIGKFTP